MAKRLEGDVLDISECLHYRLVKLKDMAAGLAAKLTDEQLQYEADKIVHEIEDIKLQIGNQITAAVLSSQARRNPPQENGI